MTLGVDAPLSPNKQTNNAYHAWRYKAVKMFTHRQ